MANYFGKRPVFVFASLLLTVCSIWGATARGFRSLLWSNIIGAFAGSSTEALGASIVNDLYFLHERGAKMGIYMNAISGGNTIGPLFCGFTLQGLSWRWHKWITVILMAINFLTVLLFVPETRYYRNGDLNTAERPTRFPILSSGQLSQTPPSATKEQPGAEESQDPPSAVLPAELPVLAPQAEVPKKTYWQELSLWSGTAPDISFFKSFLRPLPMIVYPCVIYAFLGYAVALVLTVSINILNPFVLQAPPYNWSPMINGLINIAGFLGNIAGAYAGGWLVDVYSDWKARRNGGIFEPESRLWLLVLPTLVTGAGCLVFGYGVEEKLPWISLFFGYGMVSFALTAVPTITMAYVSDCVLPVNADALMLVNGECGPPPLSYVFLTTEPLTFPLPGLKNIVAFGFLYGIVPWAEEAGYVDCFGTQAGVFVGIVALGAVLLIMYGAEARHIQAHWRIIL